MTKTITDAQRTALETLAINGSSCKGTSAMRALVRKGLVSETLRHFDRFSNIKYSVFRLTEAGQMVLKSNS